MNDTCECTNLSLTNGLNLRILCVVYRSAFLKRVHFKKRYILAFRSSRDVELCVVVCGILFSFEKVFNFHDPLS
jgi:hypothetical protein